MIKRALLAAMIATPAAAEDLFIKGFGDVFSAGLCEIGPGRCISYTAIDGEIADFCARRPKPIRVVGHSFGAMAAIEFVMEVRKCGLTVEAAFLLDPLTAPRLPSATRTRVIYSPAYASMFADGQPNQRTVDVSHVGQTFDPGIQAEIRSFLKGSRNVAP